MIGGYQHGSGTKPRGRVAKLLEQRNFEPREYTLTAVGTTQTLDAKIGHSRSEVSTVAGVVTATYPLARTAAPTQL